MDTFFLADCSELSKTFAVAPVLQFIVEALPDPAFRAFLHIIQIFNHDGRNTFKV